MCRGLILPHYLIQIVSLKFSFSIVSIHYCTEVVYVWFFFVCFWYLFQLLCAVPRGVVYGCGDLIFSSHMIFTLVFVLTYQKYGSRRLNWLINVFHLVFVEQLSMSQDFTSASFVWIIYYKKCCNIFWHPILLFGITKYVGHTPYIVNVTVIFNKF